MNPKEEAGIETTTTDVVGTTHSMLIRDAVVFQVKLVIDGFRDLVLIPASFFAALMSLIRSHDGRPGPHFYRLLGVGKQSERWIDLFAAYRNAPQDVGGEVNETETNIDDIVRRVESFVVDEYRRGGVSKQAKTHIDAALEALRRGRNRDAPGE